MSRSVSQIFDEMITEKETFSSLDTLVPNPDTAQTFLDDLTSSSKVAIWRLQLWVMAFGIFVHEQLFDQHVISIQNAAKEVTPGVLLWYAAEAKKFQNGDSLVFNTTTSKFEYTDSTSAAALAKQIITVASARDISQVVTLKVAKTVATVVQALTAAEKASFGVYLDEIKIAGTKTLVISDPPDSLKIAYTIEYDPQILTSQGVLIEDGVTLPIQVAIDTYIEVQDPDDPTTGLPFDSTFRVQDLTAAIQGATGVVNVVADVIEARTIATSYVDILIVQTEDYLANSGYLATVDSSGTEAAPVVGNVEVLTAAQAPVYLTTGAAYTADVSLVRFDDGVIDTIYKANVNIADPAGAFDPAKWETTANLTLISI